MSPRRSNSSVNRSQPSRHKLRLLLEPLEARRLLAGIHVSVFLDLNGTRDYEPTSDQPAAERLVYLDLNLNGQYDAEEPSELTDRSGHAAFQDLDVGDYSVGLLTNPDTQPQVLPSRVGAQTTELSSTGGRHLLVDADLASVWSISAAGEAQRVSHSDPLDSDPTTESIDLGGAFVASASLSEQQSLVIVDAEEGTQQAALFGLALGDVESLTIDGLGDRERIVQLTRVGDGMVALIHGTEGGSSLAVLSVRTESSPSEPRNLKSLLIGERAAASPVGIAGSANSPYLLAVGPTSTSASELSVFDPQNHFATIDTMRLDGLAESVHHSLDGNFGFVAMAGGGLQVAGIAPSGLTLAAVLSEAQFPIAAGSLDGRIVTGSGIHENEVIVWNTSQWMPSGRARMPANYRVGPGSQLASDRRGERALVLTEQGVRRIDLSLATTPRIHIETQDQQVETTFGVRILQSNEPPSVGSQPTRHLAEDTTDAFHVGQLADVADAEGDTLWFALVRPTHHGSVSLSSDGSMTYAPDPNFNGEDSAVVRVHDGQSSTELVVRLQVEPVNDAPVGILIEVPAVSETTQVGAELGFVSIVDVDADAEYRITSSDPRFTVERGRLFFSDGQLDYELESTIVIQLVATDVSDESVFIATTATIDVSDENDLPAAIRLTGWSLPENVEGAIVGEVIVEDQDADDYDFVVSDPRFTIEDGKLRLVDGVSLDYEQTTQVTLDIQATDRSAASHQISESVTLAVVNSNESPVRIELERSEVESRSPGAWVGALRVVDPDGDQYAFTVSDERFEVVGTMLTLKHGEVVNRQAEPSIPLEIAARAGNGDQITGQFNITVLPERSPYQNRENPSDVNNDGVVSPLDVLILINHLNREGGFDLTPPDGTSGGEGNANYPDVNGDGMLTPIDVLLIINLLNAQRDNGLPEPEGEAPSPFSDAAVYGPVLPHANRDSMPLEYEPMTPVTSSVPDISFADTEEFRKREAAKIDSELEALLDQLSCARHS